MTIKGATASSWTPRLLRLWRQGKAGPTDTVTPRELKSIARGVQRLSAGFTSERELIGRSYFDDPALLGAYLLFYWQLSYAQGRALLGELPPLRGAVLDLGSGPSPFAFAALDSGAPSAVAADRSRAALGVARALAQQRSAPLTTREWKHSATLPDGTYQLIVAGHFLNELTHLGAPARAEFLVKVAEKLEVGGTLLIVEPALRETSRDLLRVRDILVGAGFAIRAPCFFRGNCPALTKPSDWCHAERDWEVPPLVHAIARAAGLHKSALKMSYLAVASPGEVWAAAPEGTVFRVVSEQLAGKGRARIIGCGPSGRRPLSLQHKHETAGNREFLNLARGDVVKLEGVRASGDGLVLEPTSSVQVVHRAGERVE